MDNRLYKVVYNLGLICFAILQFIDMFITYYNVNYVEGFAECNPFMAPFVGNFLIFFLLKSLCILVIVAMAEILKKKNCMAIAVAAIWLATGFGVGIAWSNMLQMIYSLY